MKKLLFHLVIAVLAFSISLGGVSTFTFLTQFPKVEVADETSYSIAPFSLNYDIDVEYLFTIQKKTGNRGYFRVTNNSKESIFYISDGKDDHVDNWTRQNNRLKTDLICHMGMKEYELKPNESVTFNISVPKNEKLFEAGFMFYIGQDRNSLVTWRRINKQSIFDEKLDY